jgi:hypothetical protein
MVKDVEQFPYYRGGKGTVIGYRNGFYPKVKFENRKTIDGWHPDLLKRYSAAPHS